MKRTELQQYRVDAVKIAKDLTYSPDIISKIKKASSFSGIATLMAQGRWQWRTS